MIQCRNWRNLYSFQLNILLLLFIINETIGFATLPADLDKPKKCSFERTYKLTGYNCENLNLKEIPQTGLRTNFEIFDLSYNRIRELQRDSFARYTDVKYLYLFENMIQFIEKDAFADLTGLEALDISHNALTTIPLELFNLPLLRNLYVQGNALYELNRELDTLEKPIRAPLQIINLAECRLTKIPNFGILPDLWQLNISSNPLLDITLQQFAPFCNLKKLDWNETRIDMCTCQLITVNLRKRLVTIESNAIHCDPEYSPPGSCPENEKKDSQSISNSTDYEQCLAIRKSRQLNKQAKTTWFTIAAAFASCILVFILVLFYFHRKNVKRIKEKQNQIKPVYAVSEPGTGNRDKLLMNTE
uniref:Putative membrane glycoprotein lig-1 n=1 Tax=Corethrella appendiculata TaxID=1370023 RepID=U5EE05_9DIPT